ncbi:hypothetical protein ACQY0O_006602 [Thecaphora frezii]
MKVSVGFIGLLPVLASATLVGGSDAAANHLEARGVVHDHSFPALAVRGSRHGHDGVAHSRHAKRDYKNRAQKSCNPTKGGSTRPKSTTDSAVTPGSGPSTTKGSTNPASGSPETPSGSSSSGTQGKTPATGTGTTSGSPTGTKGTATANGSSTSIKGAGSGSSGTTAGAAASTGSGSNSSSGTVSADGNSLVVKGKLSSGTLPSGTDWSLLSPDYLRSGRGTTFGGEGAWQGGACMLDDLPHANLPSVAMNNVQWLDGFACGSCVKIRKTDASKFVANTQWKFEDSKAISGGNDALGDEYTLAFVSDWCPGDQCHSGLDMHPDAWKSATQNASPTELEISWRFVNCQDLFTQSGSGGKALEVKWRDGASEGFCQVQIRGAYRPVGQVEFQKQGESTWTKADHKDNSFFAAQTCGPSDKFAFRLTSVDGEIIEPVGSGYVSIGQNMIFDGGINFKSGA